MNHSMDFAQLTADLTLAAEQPDLTQAQRILSVRRKWLEQGWAPASGELGAILERGGQVIASLRQRRDGLAADVERLKQARGRLGAFHPARNQRRRLDLEM